MEKASKEEQARALKAKLESKQKIASLKNKLEEVRNLVSVMERATKTDQEAVIIAQ